MTSAFAVAETCLVVTVLSLLVWFAPARDGARPCDGAVRRGQRAARNRRRRMAYAIVIAFLEPFYVAAGFAMYLNRRAELEAWDVEQELRRAFVA